jgi:hypothetical protein
VRARRRRIWAILAFAAVFQGLALSIFADTFTSLVTLAQIVLALCFRRYAREATRRWMVREALRRGPQLNPPRPYPA